MLGGVVEVDEVGVPVPEFGGSSVSEPETGRNLDEEDPGGVADPELSPGGLIELRSCRYF
jgi:hypothetical protein